MRESFNLDLKTIRKSQQESDINNYHLYSIVLRHFVHYFDCVRTVGIKQDVKQDSRRLHNKDIPNLISGSLKPRTVRWEGHVASIEAMKNPNEYLADI
jgi:hypothetical protein